MDACTSSNQKYYERLSAEAVARHRDILFDDISKSIVRRSVQPTLSRGNVRWLDVGCGRGKGAEIAREFSAQYTGLDLAEETLRHCAERYPEAAFMRGNFIDHEFSGQYELITFISSLHHIADWPAAIRKAQALLAPGGVIFIEQEPVRFFSRLYAFYLRLFSAEYEELKSVEWHWLGAPSILSGELPAGTTEYHWDFLPFFRRLGVRTRLPWLGFFFPHYRKWIRA